MAYSVVFDNSIVSALIFIDAIVLQAQLYQLAHLCSRRGRHSQQWLWQTCGTEDKCAHSMLPLDLDAR